MVGRGEADWEHAGLEDTTTRHGVEVWENPRETDGAESRECGVVMNRKSNLVTMQFRVGYTFKWT